MLSWCFGKDSYKYRTQFIHIHFVNIAANKATCHCTNQLGSLTHCGNRVYSCLSCWKAQVVIVHHQTWLFGFHKISTILSNLFETILSPFYSEIYWHCFNHANGYNSSSSYSLFFKLNVLFFSRCWKNGLLQFVSRQDCLDFVKSISLSQICLKRIFSQDFVLMEFWYCFNLEDDCNLIIQFVFLQIDNALTA